MMNKGVSQKSRKSDSLLRHESIIDDRKPLDFLLSVFEFSKNLKFIEAGKPHSEALKNPLYKGAWDSFFLNEAIFITAKIANTNLQKFRDRYDLAMAKNDKEVLSVTHELFEEARTWSELFLKTDTSNELKQEIRALLNSKNTFRNNEKPTDAQEFSDSSAGFNWLYGNMLFVQKKAQNRINQKEITFSDLNPQVALLLAFFELFQYSIKQLNTLTQRHLDYYYNDLLGLQKQSHSSYSGLIEFKLNEGAEFIEIKQQQLFDFSTKSGVSGKVRSSMDLQLNQTEINDVFALRKRSIDLYQTDNSNEGPRIQKLYQTVIYPNLQDEDFGTEPLRSHFPLILGEEGKRNKDVSSQVESSSIGWAISSPLFLMEVGQQKLRITFVLDEDSASETFEQLAELKSSINHEMSSLSYSDAEFLENAFRVFVTTEEGWLEADDFQILFESNQLIFSVSLLKMDEQLVPLSKEIHQESFDSKWPCVKVILDPENSFYPYSILRRIEFKKIKVDTEVDNVTELTLANTNGGVDHSIPFTPFGPMPKIGSYLKIENSLIFNKFLKECQLKLKWSGLPQSPGGFAAHYKHYEEDLNNRSFQMSIRKDRVRQKENDLGVFDLFAYTSEEGELKDSLRIDLNVDALDFNGPLITDIELESMRKESLFLTLTEPSIAFGHERFPELFSSAALKKEKDSKGNFILPKQPYTPVLENISIQYASATEVNFKRSNNDLDTRMSFFHIQPFGFTKVSPNQETAFKSFLPQIHHASSLYIGIKHVQPEMEISMGVELYPSVTNHTVMSSPKVVWEYLANNEWHPFGGRILEDSTKNLMKTGILKFSSPSQIDLESTIMPPDQFWIRAISNDPENLNSRVKRIFTQALKVDFLMDEMMQQVLESDVKGFKMKLTKGVQGAKGIYGFIGDNYSENNERFNTRVSELLRHKNRPLTSWDYERMVLERFRDVQMVRVYGRNQKPNELVRGNSVQVVVIPRQIKSNFTGPASVMVPQFRLHEIKKFLSNYVSPFVNIEVSNPTYEWIKVRCAVQFTAIEMKGKQIEVLNQDLIQFLSPDINKLSNSEGFERTISKSSIFNFIQGLDYVKYVTKFSVLQLIEARGTYRIIDLEFYKNRIETLRTISAYAILTSANKHQIEMIQHQNDLASERAEIGNLSIESDFIISNDNNEYF